ncbi:TatD family hydrolase [Paenibacillus albicereus]|uniref:TatD family hydrolase n=1 Tax=Paenibacillus albicereus TaxID=2726185 RepID=A0A6H2GYT1_9BACL|nr:TatD family hydrolase [Paenibacillus albicereus]QJC52336.1 TatD family hydrolase [Paenibacillus albicereus]
MIGIGKDGQASGLGERGSAAAALYDTHLHLEQYGERERERMLEEAGQEGVRGIVAVSMDLASSRRTRELALRHPELVLPAYGWHPEQALPQDGELDELIGWIRERHAAGERFAIGEVGLPYYTRTEAESAGASFDESGHIGTLDRFAALAAELDRPLVLHAVYEDALKAAKLLLRHGVRRAHFHWYKGDAETTGVLAQAGWSVSVTPDVLYEPEIRELAASYPLGQLMTETDGPWPFEGPFSGRPTHPLLVREAAREIARLRGLGEHEAVGALADNARRFYGFG